MSPPLAGKHALVVGASRGIGRAIAERLAADGADVSVTYRDRRAAADGVVAAIRAGGGRAVAIGGDIARLDAIAGLFDAAEAAFGPPDIVVANAGAAVIKPVVDSTEADFDAVFDVNAKGTFFVLAEAARRLREGGRIVAVSTGGTRMFFTQTAVYLGSKGAVEQFVRTLSRELGPRRITVNAVSPGFTDTDLLPERDRAVAAEMSVFKRVGEPGDIADVVAFLAGHGARWITGQNIAVGGGVM